MSRLKLFALALAAALIGAGTLVAPTTAAAATPDCEAFDDPIYRGINPTSGGSLLTPWSQELTKATSFSQARGVIFTASIQSDATLAPVHRLRKSSGGDYLYENDSQQIKDAVADGYVDQGSSFSAATSGANCLEPVYRYERSGKHRFALQASERNALVADGWTAAGIAFYAADPNPDSDPAPPAEPAGDTEFTFAVMPDTQQEVLRSNDTRFANRTKWLATQKRDLDLRFVTHTGDVVNWDTPDHSQYKVASAAMTPLEDADVPYTLAIGNHDTEATGAGGGARDPKNTRTLQRDTTTFNSYFTAERYGTVSAEFEKNKVDNVYALYEAGGVKWMVLVLELWPRQSVVDWAKKAVADHPDYNVVIVTHSYLNESGEIDTSAGYGDTSPMQLWDKLVSQYANIRMVFSGHVGQAMHRVDTGIKGNEIFTYTEAFHSNTTNPVRLVTVDTATNSLKTWIYCPSTNETWSQYTVTDKDLDLVH